MSPTESLITKAIEAAQENLKSTTCLLPTFFVGSKEKMDIVGAPFGDDKEKDLAAAFVKNLAKDMNAEFILFIAESYTIKDQVAAKEYMANLSKYKTMADHPKAIEVVIFMLETKTRNWQAIVDLLPNRELGAVKWMEATKLDGRFSNLLGEKPTIQ